jgi:hypothetical protein
LTQQGAVVPAQATERLTDQGLRIEPGAAGTFVSDHELRDQVRILSKTRHFIRWQTRVTAVH